MLRGSCSRGISALARQTHPRCTVATPTANHRCFFLIPDELFGNQLYIVKVIEPSTKVKVCSCNVPSTQWACRRRLEILPRSANVTGCTVYNTSQGNCRRQTSPQVRPSQRVLIADLYRWAKFGRSLVRRPCRILIGPVVAEIFGGLYRFRPSRPKRCSCYPRNLWGYWTDLDHICTRRSYNIAIENFWTGTTIFLPVPQRQPAKWRSFSNFAQFCQKLVAMATFREELKKRGPDRSYSRTYLSFGDKKSWKSVQWILR